MKYLYHVRIGSILKQFSKIIYRTNNKQAAYRYAWNLVKNHADCCPELAFPTIYFKGHFEATLVAYGD